ncbi:hypothetical protein MFRU_007g02160 [Monilinia fructicola]|nr:hypothetical protein MFRU_007g02160 [Monilinia fructicola]
MAQEMRGRIDELKGERMQLLAVQERENFEKKLSKTGKESLELMIKDAFNDVEASLEKKRRDFNGEA